MKRRKKIFNRSKELKERKRRVDELDRRGLIKPPLTKEILVAFPTILKPTKESIREELLRGIKIIDKNTTNDMYLDTLDWKEFTQELERIVNWYVDWFLETFHLGNHKRHDVYKGAKPLIRDTILSSSPFDELLIKKIESQETPSRSFKELHFCPFCEALIPNLNEWEFCPFCLEILQSKQFRTSVKKTSKEGNKEDLFSHHSKPRK